MSVKYLALLLLGLQGILLVVGLLALLVGAQEEISSVEHGDEKVIEKTITELDIAGLRCTLRKSIRIWHFGVAVFLLVALGVMECFLFKR